MGKTEHAEQLYPFDAGPLGQIDGLTVTNVESKEPLLRYFGGIPYALPPTGPYRFRRPRPLPDHYRYWTKARPGHFVGSTALCPQPKSGQDSDSSLWDEDCLQLNIYIPAAKPQPSNGWPVFFYIHGGYLQWGSANFSARALTPLLSETAFEAVVVVPAYRLNLFGFLSSRELQAEAEKAAEAAGNLGFWDQRAALEWTAKNIGYFGGNASNITVGGYSAGSHSAFHQLAHELYFVPDDRAVIRRTIMWSNSPGVQPRTATAHQKQFDELLGALNIPLSLPAGEKLARLRALPASDLVHVQDRLNLSEFRATSDGAFVAKDLISRINSGDFARRVKARGIKLMNGECRDEHNLYRNWRTPAQTHDAVLTRLTADYPEPIVRRLMHYHCGESGRLPEGVGSWQELFGRLYADMQVHCLERGFHRALAKGGLKFGRDVLRYRFDWRASCVEMPPEWGVTHATDMAIWFWGLDYGSGLSSEDKAAMKPWNVAFAAFLRGEDPLWNTNHVTEMKRLRSDGQTDVWVDANWDQGLEIWDLVNGSEVSGVMGWFKARL